MDFSVITLYSNEVPNMPNLEAIDTEVLQSKIIVQLQQNKYAFVSEQPGITAPIEGYKTSLQQSEIVLHACLRENNSPAEPDTVNELLLEHIAHNKLKIVEAIRHVDGPFTRIVANLDS